MLSVMSGSIVLGMVGWSRRKQDKQKYLEIPIEIRTRSGTHVEYSFGFRSLSATPPPSSLQRRRCLC